MMLRRTHFCSVLTVSPGRIRILTTYKSVFLKSYRISFGSFGPGSNIKAFLILVCLVTVLANSGCSKKTGAEEGEGPSPERSPAEELSSFQLADGLQIQLVAAEPMVQDPVVILFDPDGRLWVVEMRGFMPDIDGNG